MLKCNAPLNLEVGNLHADFIHCFTQGMTGCNWRGFGELGTQTLPRFLSLSWKSWDQLVMLAFFPVTLPCQLVCPTKKDFTRARTWSVHLLGNLRQLREKRVRKGLCKETKAGKSVMTDATVPLTKLLLLESEKEEREKANIYLALAVYLVIVLDSSHSIGGVVILILQVGKLS